MIPDLPGQELVKKIRIEEGMADTFIATVSLKDGRVAGVSANGLLEMFFKIQQQLEEVANEKS